MRSHIVAALMALMVASGCNCSCTTPVNPDNDGGGGTGGSSGGTGGGFGGGGSTGGGLGGGAGGGVGDGGCGLVTCTSSGVECGQIGDGCGNILDCGACAYPMTCGGGGLPSRCGGDGGCQPFTCADYNANCGPMGTGCGTIIDCGACTSPETCGGGGIAGRCGVGGSGDGGCNPRSCSATDAGCGPVGDGCGGLLDCGTCTAPDTCGGGGVGPSQCGHDICTPRTCAAAMATCGVVGDGCGFGMSCDALDGGCTAPATCGGAGVANTCGNPPVCVPQTCATIGANCGVQGDGCGGLTPVCGTCVTPDICGGAGVPNRCGHRSPDGGVCMTLLCQEQVQCDSGTTTVSGVVLAPTDSTAGYGNPDPIPNALVYVPNDVVQAFDAGVSCEACAASVTGDPLVYATSAVNGSFTVTNVPCGTNIPLVIQLGRWRRQITIPSVACCANTALTAAQTRLPRTQGEGDPNDNIPLIAVVTGYVDTIECVLPKIGIAASQYSLPSGTGRVRFYRDNGAGMTGGAPAATTLFNSLAEMQKYDLIILDCVGSQVVKTAAQRANLEAYANGGGRVFSSHYGYVWLYGTPSANSFTPTATWQPMQADPPNQDANIDVSFPKGLTFGQWVYQVGAQAATSTPAQPRVRVNNVRHDFNAVIPPAERWVYGTSAGTPPLQYTFNTPTAAPSSSQCGRVLFSDFHVINANVANGTNWPAQCSVGPMTAQEKVFEYLIFDLSSCVTPYIQSCTAKTCADLGSNCGQQGDGCGGVVNCGSCTTPATCGGGGQAGVCGTGCTPLTCGQLGFSCGMQGDGCGNLVDCGTCAPPLSCGGGGQPGQCGGTICTPLTCAGQGFNCGMQTDGCGASIDCGTCVPPLTCGAQTPGVCGTVTCAGLTCAQQGLTCGPTGDGCGNVIQCGSCTPPDTCGGGGTAGRCGHAICTPNTCAALGFNCGPAADGCGLTMDCGTCTPPQTCGGGGRANICGMIN